jgi:hypothetical protein
MAGLALLGGSFAPLHIGAGQERLDRLFRLRSGRSAARWGFFLDGNVISGLFRRYRRKYRVRRQIERQQAQERKQDGAQDFVDFEGIHREKLSETSQRGKESGGSDHILRRRDSRFDAPLATHSGELPDRRFTDHFRIFLPFPAAHFQEPCPHLT